MFFFVRTNRGPNVLAHPVHELATSHVPNVAFQRKTIDETIVKVQGLGLRISGVFAATTAWVWKLWGRPDVLLSIRRIHKKQS